MAVEIPFSASFDGDPVSCDSGTQGAALSDLRFFVHGLELRTVDGRWQPVRLAVDGRWQQQDLGLVDLENAGGACLNGTTGMHSVLAGTVPALDYRGIRFVVGVPFERNHADPLTASSPLDDSAMHWHWRSGYKFLRAGLATSDDGFWLHLGSAACQGTVRNISGCGLPNRIRVELPDFVPGEQGIEFGLSALLAGTDLNDGQRSDCSSGPSESACRSPFSALGIDFETGELIATQRVFKTVRR